MMHVAFATTRLTKYDAASNYTVAVIKELSKNNKVDLYAFSIERDIPKGAKQHTYTEKNEHSLSSVLFVITKIYSLAKKFSKYDMVVLVGPDFTILPGIHLAKCFNPNLKLVWDFHGLTPPQFLQDSMQRFLTRIRQTAYIWSMKRSNCIMVRSDYIRKEIGHQIRSDIEVLHIGINTVRFRSDDGKAIQKKYNLNDKFVMIYVGRLAASKRIDFLIKAMASLDKAVLLIVGDGDEMDKLKNLAHSSNIEEKIIFVGKVSDEELPQYYAASDVFVTASLHEGFCVPIIEALASGKPVVVPNRTAMPEVAGDCGLVYDGSMEDFVNKINRLKKDEILRNELRLKALERARKFNIDDILMHYEDLIMDTYNEKRK